VIVGGDTDSCYFTVPEAKTIETAFQVGFRVCSVINDMFGFPIVLEMEKVYTPFVYLAKKNYFAIMYETPSGVGKFDVKGIALARGDSSKLTKDLQLTIISSILNNPENPWKGVKTLVQDAIKTIKSTDRDMFIKTKKLGSGYKHPERQIQTCVVAKMVARGQQEPVPGDLVPYLVARGTKRKISEMADHPDYVEELDYSYYIDSQVIKPLTRFFGVLNKDWRDEIVY
jgi:DNA polymerase elongation subunit (family B)